MDEHAKQVVCEIDARLKKVLLEMLADCDACVPIKKSHYTEIKNLIHEQDLLARHQSCGKL